MPRLEPANFDRRELLGCAGGSSRMELQGLRSLVVLQHTCPDLLKAEICTPIGPFIAVLVEQTPTTHCQRTLTSSKRLWTRARTCLTDTGDTSGSTPVPGTGVEVVVVTIILTAVIILGDTMIQQ